jgi:hypothetical protein
MGKSSAPTPPDFSKLAGLDTAQAKDLAQFSAGLNRADQSTPFGTSKWTQTPQFNEAGYNTALADWQGKNQRGTFVPQSDGTLTGYDANGQALYGGATQAHWDGATSSGTAMPTKEQFTTPSWSQSVEFTPEQQALYDSNNKLQQGFNNTALAGLDNVQKTLSTPVDTSHLPGLATAPQGGDDASRQRVENALFSRLDPKIQQDRHDLDSRLLNSGIEKGTDAWNRAQTQQSQQENDARMSAILAGGQEDTRQFNIGLAGANQQNQTRQQGLAELLGLRQQPINEANALRSGGQVTAPQFQPYYTTGTGPGGSAMQGGLAQNNAANAQYANNTASDNATYSALAAIAMAAISDQRLKTNIRVIGRHPTGVRRVSWDWTDGKGSDHGVIAQELMTVRPDAVFRLPSGFYSVNYNLIGGR